MRYSSEVKLNPAILREIAERFAVPMAKVQTWNLPDYLDVHAVGRRLRLSERSVRELVKAGRLFAYGRGQGRRLAFAPHEVEEFAQASARALARMLAGVVAESVPDGAVQWFASGSAGHLAGLPAGDNWMDRALDLASRLTPPALRFLTAFVFAYAHPEAMRHTGKVERHAIRLPGWSKVTVTISSGKKYEAAVRSTKFWSALNAKVQTLPNLAARNLIERAQEATQRAAQEHVHARMMAAMGLSSDHRTALGVLGSLAQGVGVSAGLVPFIVQDWIERYPRPALPMAARVGRLLGLERSESARLWRECRRKLGRCDAGMDVLEVFGIPARRYAAPEPEPDGDDVEAMLRERCPSVYV